MDCGLEIRTSPLVASRSMWLWETTTGNIFRQNAEPPVEEYSGYSSLAHAGLQRGSKGLCKSFLPLLHCCNRHSSR